MQIFPNGVAKLDEATEEPLKVGDKAPNFTYPNQQNQPVSLSDFAGRPVVLYILGSLGNDLTRSKFERLIRLAPEIERAGAAVLALSSNFWQVSRDYSQSRNVTFPILDNELGLEGISTFEQPVSDRETAYPVYVLRPDQAIAYVKTGDDVFDENHAPELLAAIAGIAGLTPARPVRPLTPAGTVSPAVSPPIANS